MSQPISAFFFGFSVGAALSLTGAFCSYWFGLRRTTGSSRAPLVYLMLAVLLLGILGAVALTLSFLSGTVLLAVIAGVGVILGFSAMFALIIAFWLVLDCR